MHLQCPFLNLTGPYYLVTSIDMLKKVTGPGNSQGWHVDA